MNNTQGTDQAITDTPEFPTEAKIQQQMTKNEQPVV